MQSSSTRRGLSTARAALQVAWLLAARPDGIRADDVAEEIGKSVSTAYNLLVSLCDEGVAVHHSGGLYRLAPAFREAVASGTVRQAPELHDASGIVAELFARTHKRTYLGVVRDGELHVILERGAQGMPKLPGLGARIATNAHAVALGKVVLALAPPEVVERYLRLGLRRFTAHTIADSGALRDELRAVRRRGFAVEREEFGEDFCCIAAPILHGRGRFIAAIGISMTRRAFDDEHDALARTVLEVARAAGAQAAEPAARDALARHFQVSAETPELLDPRSEPALVSSCGTTVP